MSTVYIYAIDTLADWEIGYITSELNSGRFFKKGEKQIPIKYVSCTNKPITTMGGLTIMPDCLVEEIILNEKNVLILPGADTWNNPSHNPIIEMAKKFLEIGATVCAICGATTALANAGILDNRRHTSNGPGFLEMFAPGYHGTKFYEDCLAVSDNHLITAGSTGALLWTKQIIAAMNIFEEDALESWYDYFSTGESKYFFQLMQQVNK
ncbi:MAG: glutamine amidotransferase [Cellulosilyticum sp.]|nr:glutamine amidotransferase [Cellulosilyticum sp.]